MRRGKFETPVPALNFMMTLAVVLFWLVMITTYMSAGLYAKYSTGNTGGDKAQVITFGELIVRENEIEGSTGEEYIFMPGVDLKKDITISFGGSEADTFVFAELDTPGWERSGTHGFSLQHSGKTIMSWSVGDRWTYLTSQENQHIYYLQLEANEPLYGIEVIKEGRISVSESGTRADYKALKDRLADTSNNYELKIDVTAHIVQANGFYLSEDMEANAAAAWNSLNK